MVSCCGPARVQRPTTSWAGRSHSPLEITPHKARNGELTNTCRNRHCPKCQATARARWLEQREAELLPVPYFHVVFTLPKQIGYLALQNASTIYNILFRAAAQTLLETAADPRLLGASIGFLAVLHTWGQNLHLNPHS